MTEENPSSAVCAYLCDQWAILAMAMDVICVHLRYLR